LVYRITASELVEGIRQRNYTVDMAYRRAAQAVGVSSASR
jgi:hypothetical protein